MYETLQLNGHKIDPKDDVRRDDMHEAAIEFARNISLGKVCRLPCLLRHDSRSFSGATTGLHEPVPFPVHTRLCLDD